MGDIYSGQENSSHGGIRSSERNNNAQAPNGGITTGGGNLTGHRRVLTST